MTTEALPPLAADQIGPLHTGSAYPPPFAALVQGRGKRKLGDHFGLTNFGINLTELAPGAISALFHRHHRQDEFIYILEGTATLRLGDDQYSLKAGDCCGFKAGGPAHQLINSGPTPLRYLEIGDRTDGDAVDYPENDLKAEMVNGKWRMTNKAGEGV